MYFAGRRMSLVVLPDVFAVAQLISPIALSLHKLYVGKLIEIKNRNACISAFR